MGETAVVAMPTSMQQSRAPARPFVRVEIHRAALTVLDAWADLESRAPCSIYQTRAWLLPWIETLARRSGIAPFFVLAVGADERPAALLCLGLIRRGPIRVATWLGGKDSNFNMPLMPSGSAWDRRDVTRLLRDAARAFGRDGPDVFALVNQPFAWNGQANPFALVAHQKSASSAYGTALQRDADAVLGTKFSKESRRKLRKKETRLAAFGPLTYEVVTEPEARAAAIDAFLDMKRARFRDQKIASTFDWPEMRDFIEAASKPGAAGIELHVLRAGARIFAACGGAAHGGQWSGMFTAFDADDAIAKTSPGELLLMRVMAKACNDGLTRMDLGVGEARYKSVFCGEEIPLFDSVLPVTPRGRLFAPIARAALYTKRVVKQNPRLLALAKRLRA